MLAPSCGSRSRPGAMGRAPASSRSTPPRASTRWPACWAASGSPRPRAATPRKCCKTPALRVHQYAGTGGRLRPEEAESPPRRRAMESAVGGKSGLVLAGGGARAAYQVGVLQAIRDMLPDPAVNPFPIICGTSAGAVNAGALAVRADDFGMAGENPLHVLRHFQPPPL